MFVTVVGVFLFVCFVVVVVVVIITSFFVLFFKSEKKESETEVYSPKADVAVRFNRKCLLIYVSIWGLLIVFIYDWPVRLVSIGLPIGLLPRSAHGVADRPDSTQVIFKLDVEKNKTVLR